MGSNEHISVSLIDNAKHETFYCVFDDVEKSAMQFSMQRIHLACCVLKYMSEKHRAIDIKKLAFILDYTILEFPCLGVIRYFKALDGIKPPLSR